MKVETLAGKFPYKNSKREIIDFNIFSNPKDMPKSLIESSAMYFWIHKCDRKKRMSVYPLPDWKGMHFVCECKANKIFKSKVLNQQWIDILTKIPNVLRIRDLEKI